MEHNDPSQKPGENNTQASKWTGAPIRRTPSFKQLFASAVGSNSASAPDSAMSSPMLSALSDVTPLPSPLLTGDSPGPWKKLTSRPTSREIVMPPITADSALVTVNGESISSAITNQSKRRAYHGLINEVNETGLNKPHSKQEDLSTGHNKNRSISEYMPEPLQLPKSRLQAVSGSHIIPSVSSTEPQSATDALMRREPHLSISRGIASIPKPPTPPSSRAGGECSDSDSSISNTASFSPLSYKKPRYEYFEAYTLSDHKRRRWRALKQLGQGTFSKVILATSQTREEYNTINENDVSGKQNDGVISPTESNIDIKKLVAVKICEHGPKGGASEERVEISLKRELELMKSIHHPSLVHLKAWNIEEARAILVLSYCPGGDLFEVASEHRTLLVPALLKRMFAELVAAIAYLHERHIVHRDIKLESELPNTLVQPLFVLISTDVLVNLPQHELAQSIDWVTYPYSVITLTDLGLSRRVADDEKLTTRCGSDDYAAPEVIMGQSYDGRAVDAWSLGVLLYALLEARLPFDPTPGMPESHKQRSKTSHRIARVEWRWVEYAGDDGDHEGDIAKFEEDGLVGAMEVTENLLKRARSRWTIQKVSEQDWVRSAIQVDGGIKFREEDTAEEISKAYAL